VTLGPVWLDLDGLLGILQSLLVFVLSGVDSGAVGEEDMVLRFDSKSLGEFLAAMYQSWSTESNVKRWGIART
jgi:hypothetical protein